MKKKLVTLLISLFFLCGATACGTGGSATPQSMPRRETTAEECPGGDCPEQEECPDGDCPDQKECPDGDCPEQEDGQDEIPHRHVRPVHPVHPRLPDDRPFPPHFPIRPVQPVPEPTL